MLDIENMKIADPALFRNDLRKKVNKLVRNKKLTLNLEKGVYNYAIGIARERNVVRKWDNPHFQRIYIDRIRTIYANLSKKSRVGNKNLVKRLRKGTITPQQLAFMSHQEMFPEKWRELIDAKIERDRHATEVDMSAATDEFCCYKCKKRQCTYYQLQTRSADEPMTTFVTCLHCGNRWRC